MPSLPIEDLDGILVLRVPDDASINDAQSLAIRPGLYQAIANQDRPLVAIDLSVVDYLSSTGIALLIGTKRRVEGKQGRLVLYELHPDILDLFRAMKLANLFEIAVDETSALARIGTPLAE